MIWYNNLTDELILEYCTEYMNLLQQNKRVTLLIPMGFDIETTNDDKTEAAYMYIWQFAINNNVIFGTEWSEFIELNKRIKNILGLNKNKKIVIFIHNDKFEWQFMRKHLDMNFNLSTFILDERHPGAIILDECIEYHDSYLLSQCSLKKTAETYCKTQKLPDFDYSIKRNKKDALKMSDRELEYCANDVLILTEYYKYYIENVITVDGFFPLTQTSIVRNKIKSEFNKTGKYTVEYEKFDKKGKLKTYKKTKNKNKELMHKLFPKDKTSYDTIMNYLYRGGYTHANSENVGEIHKDVMHIDFTSSYPAVLLHNYYPMTEFKRINDYKNINKYIENNCCIIKVKFTDIKSKTSITFDSISKAFYYDKKSTIDDNGRLFKSREYVTYLTELDYLIYKNVYTWNKMEILDFWISDKGELPEYVTKVIIDAYKEKSKIKKYGDSKGKDKIKYEYFKRFVNSIYGCMCTKINDLDIVYNNGIYIDSPTNKSWYEIVDASILSPYWGIWCTAHARYNLFDLIIKLINRNETHLYIYSDTDSHFILKNDFIVNYIDEWNNKIAKINKKFDELLDDLGTFDIEHSKGITRFKTLGAKRYLLETYDKKDNLIIEATIAGLPKISNIERDGDIIEVSKFELVANNRKEDAFDLFNNNMFFDEAEATKNICKYNDNVTSTIINGEKMTELSSCYIYPTTFKLSMTDTFLSVIYEQSKRKEKRIYG